MPSQTAHYLQAEHNANAASHIIESSEYYDWSATMAFYAAVHYVESVLDFFHTKKYELQYFNHTVIIAHSDDLKGNDKYPSYTGKPLYSPHPIRKQIVESNFIIGEAYNLLENASWTQRYTNWKQNNHSKCKRLLEKHLKRIKEWHDSIVKIEEFKDQITLHSEQTSKQ